MSLLLLLPEIHRHGLVILIHDKSCSEALPFMYSTPLYTCGPPTCITAINDTKFSTLRHIRKLHIEVSFGQFPSLEYYHSKALECIDRAQWLRLCRSLTSMTSLAYLCITIRQSCRLWSTDENIRLVKELLKPLNLIEVARRGQFDVVTKGWRVPYELDGVPFRLLSERTIPPQSRWALANAGFSPVYRKPASIPPE